jgi:serine protease Do
VKKQLWISISLALLLLVGGGVGVYFLSHFFQSQPVYAKSKLVDQLPKVTKQTTKQKAKTQDLKTIIHNNQKNVVQIDVTTDQGTVIGSGFLYNTKGDVITNAHVVSGATSVTVQTADEQKYKGQVIGVGDTDDVAVVRVPSLANKTPMKLATKRKAELGDQVLALGSPLALQNTVTTGIISGVNRDLTIDPYTYHHVYQIDAPITHGNSGGPLLDAKTGEVLGINSAGTDSGTIGFSIPLPDVYDEIIKWSEHPSDLGTANSDTSSQTTADDSSLSGADLKSQADYLVQYFYESLDSNDYVTAYSLLGSSFQSKVSYESFRSGYLNTENVTINDSTSTLEGNQVNENVVVQADERNNGLTQTSLYKATYTVGYEDDQLKILSGTAQKLQ